MVDPATPDAASREPERPAAATPAAATPAAATPAAAAPAGAPPALGEDTVKAVLRRVKDPELNLNIVDLGLVYAITVDGATVSVDLTLTSPGCPSGPEIFGMVEEQLRSLPGVEDVSVNLVWDPLWSPDRIEPRIKAYLGF